VSPERLRLYHKLPYFAKCVLATVHGLGLKSIRTGRYYKQELQAAAIRSTWTESQWRDFERRELARVLQTAIRHVPWYRRNVSIPAGSITPENALDRLLAFPVVTRSVIGENPEGFVDERFRRVKLHVEYTSGTTGAPFRFWQSDRTVQRWYALGHLRWLGGAGVRCGDRCATFGGQVIASTNRKSPPYWVRNLAMNQLYCSVYHVGPSTVNAYLRILQAFDPVYIMCYPSALHALVSLARDAGLAWQGGSVKAVITNAEPLYDSQRDAIEGYFGCRCYETYGCSESVFMGYECPARHIHLCPDVGFSEVLDSTGQRAADGESGELVCTGFLTDAMPLIRYRTGDRVSISRGGCPCGSTFPVLRAIEGRDGDEVVLPDGRIVGCLYTVIDGDFAIREAQIIQEGADLLRVLVIPSRDYDESTHPGLIADSVHLHVGNKVRVEVMTVSEIPRSPSGKFRAVACRLSEEEKRRLSRSAP
jgi:phenylacetate-CoA ligase